MRIKLEELRALVKREIAEAKKKKTKDADEIQPKGYEPDPNFDFSKPMGDANHLKRQGASNLGPYTSENALRFFVRECIKEGLAEVVTEKHIGFKKLKNMLAKKGVKDPAALAASIGRKKLGQATMTARSVAGKKK